MSGGRAHRWAAEGAIAFALLSAVAVVGAIVLLGTEARVLALLRWLDGYPLWAPALFLAAYALIVVLMLPGVLFTLAAGFLFGLAKGAALVVIGEMAGAMAAFLIGRTLLGTRAAAVLERHPRLRAFNDCARTDGWRVVLFTRLIPMFPGKASNYFFGLADYSFRDFVLGTFFGIIPFTLTNVWAGSLAADLATLGARSGQRSTLDWWINGGGLLLSVAAAVYLVRLARRVLRQQADHSGPEPDGDPRRNHG